MKPVLGYRPLWMELPVSMWPAYFEGERRLAQVKRHSRGTAGHAFSRLRITTRLDREACNDGKWVKVSEGAYFYWPIEAASPTFINEKPRFRWERRR